MILRIGKTLHARLKNAVAESVPREYCAVLHGAVSEGDVLNLEAMTPVTNYARSVRFFAVREQDVAGIGEYDVFFHSHTGRSGALSRFDRKNLARLGERLIVGTLWNGQLQLRGYDGETGTLTVEHQ